jgi:hypothetical protein
MNVTIEIPEDRAARFQKEAQARGLTVDKWLLELGEQHAPPPTQVTAKNLVELFEPIRGLFEDGELDFSRNRSTGRPVNFE